MLLSSKMNVDDMVPLTLDRAGADKSISRSESKRLRCGISWGPRKIVCSAREICTKTKSFVIGHLFVSPNNTCVPAKRSTTSDEHSKALAKTFSNATAGRCSLQLDNPISRNDVTFKKVRTAAIVASLCIYLVWFELNVQSQLIDKIYLDPKRPSI